MSKILVSDFDGTIKTSSKYINYLNFKALRKFKENGNKLVIASARDFNSLKSNLVNNSLYYDALICNDGGSIFSKDNELLYGLFFENQELENIIYFFKKQGNKYIKRIDLYNKFGFTYTQNNIIEVALLLKSFKNVERLLKFSTDYFNNIQINKVGQFAYIRKKSNKSSALKKLSEIYGLDKNDIVAIGDGINDYEMIRDYKGYNVLYSHPILYKVSNGTVISTSQLVKKLEKNKR